METSEGILYATTLSVTVADGNGASRLVNATVRGDEPHKGRHRVKLAGPAGKRRLTVDGSAAVTDGAVSDAERIEKVEEHSKVTISLRMED